MKSHLYSFSLGVLTLAVMTVALQPAPEPVSNDQIIDALALVLEDDHAVKRSLPKPPRTPYCKTSTLGCEIDILTALTFEGN